MPQDVGLQTRIHSWFMHGGVPLHFLLSVWEFLNNVFPRQWVGRSGTTAWFDLASVFIPLDFYLWELLKSHIYVTEGIRHPELATTITEWIPDDSKDT